MNETSSEKITIQLPHSVYHALRNQAKKQNLSLPEMVQQKIVLEPAEPGSLERLAKLPLREILARTAPVGMDPDDRLDFFA
ncbi:hypothetical protein JO972_13610 [Verrucomicrobiaceae bacterium 5K15]|uniref:Uncharacterized protein n=1 Tax=Oceaniferula flava TaxID=2800421 RepID=A0AAE2V8T4_9BACT|nr:hypothetical protein [Oceaniferula flavus]MBK1856002.1 hypothetical protein [Oceaniferula flavus]MBM1137309.1 hypothetical protein [Oceaniferula flavus]